MRRNLKLVLGIGIILIGLSFVIDPMIIVGIGSFIILPIFIYKNWDKLRSERDPFRGFGGQHDDNSNEDRYDEGYEDGYQDRYDR